MRVSAIVPAVAMLATACGGATSATTSTTATPTTTTSTVVTTTSTAVAVPTTTVAPIDGEAGVAVGQEFLRAMIDQNSSDAFALASQDVSVAWAPDSTLESAIGEAGDWGMETLSVTCEEQSRTATILRLGCSVVLTDTFSRVAPYDYILEMRVEVRDLRVDKVRGLELVDATATVEGATGTVSDFARAWQIATYPDGIEGVGHGCKPSDPGYCAGLFIATAKEFWIAHPEMRAAVAVSG